MPTRLLRLFLVRYILTHLTKKGKTNEDEKRNGLYYHRSNRWDDCLIFLEAGIRLL